MSSVELCYTCNILDTFLYNANYLKYCYIEDQDIISNIANATENCNSLQPYGFYDLNLNDYDKFILSNLEFSQYNTMNNYGNLDTLEYEITDLIKRTNINEPRDLIANHVAKLTTKLVSNIIDASNFTNARVTLVTSVIYDTVDWHVDKSFKEMLDPFDDSDQYIYLFTLKGSSTLYFPIKENLREQFFSYAKDLDIVYGDDLYTDSKINDLFDLKEVSYADFNWGSVHVMGKINGAIHSAPINGNRLVVLVYPQTNLMIEKNQQYLSDLNSKWTQTYDLELVSI